MRPCIGGSSKSSAEYTPLSWSRWPGRCYVCWSPNAPRRPLWPAPCRPSRPALAASCLRRVRRWWRGSAARTGDAQSSADPPRAHRPGGGPARGGALDTTRLGPGKSGWPASSLRVARSRSAGRSSRIPGPRALPGRRRWRSSSSSSGPSQRAVRWTLVADRGFPSAVLFAQLRQGGTDFSVRLRLSDWVTVARVYATVGDAFDAGRLASGSGRRRPWDGAPRPAARAGRRRGERRGG